MKKKVILFITLFVVLFITIFLLGGFFLDVAIDKSENPVVRTKAVRWLVKIRQEQAVKKISPILLDDTEDENLRVVIAALLGDIGGREAITALSEATNDNNKFIRHKAYQSLGEISDPATMSIVQKGLTDPDEHVRSSAIRAIGAIGNETHLVLMTNFIESTDDTFIKISCITAIGKIGGEKAINILRKLESDEDELIRINAQRQLFILSNAK